MTTTSVSPSGTLKILKLLLDGRDATFVAAATATSPDHVRDVATANGWPDRAKAEWAVDELTKQIEGRASITPPPTYDNAAPLRAAVDQAPPAPSPHPDNPALLIAIGKKSQSKRIQAAATRAEDALAKLETLLNRDAEQRKAKAAEDAERAKIRDKVARLRRELAAAEKALKTGTTADTSDPSPKDVRAWAATAGVEVSPNGRVPRHIVEQYIAAHPQQ